MHSKNRAAQGIVEYALLVALIVIAVVSMLLTVGNRTSGTVSNAAQSLGASGAQDTETEQYLHVDGIEMSAHAEGQSTRIAAVVTVVDEDGSAVGQAEVSVTWWVNDEEAETETDSTDGQGRARLSYRSSDLESGDVVELVVDYIDATDYAYDSSSDVVSSAQLTLP